MQTVQLGKVAVEAIVDNGEATYHVRIDSGQTGSGGTVGSALRVLAAAIEVRDGANRPLATEGVEEFVLTLATASPEALRSLRGVARIDTSVPGWQEVLTDFCNEEGRALSALLRVPSELLTKALDAHGLGLRTRATFGVVREATIRRREAGKAVEYVYTVTSQVVGSHAVRVLLASEQEFAMPPAPPQDARRLSVDVCSWMERVQTFMQEAQDAMNASPHVRWADRQSASAVFASFLLGLVRHMHYRGITTCEEGDDPWYALALAILGRMGLDSMAKLNAYPTTTHDDLRAVLSVSTGGGPVQAVRGPEGLQ